jgi:sigma-B regulation protein RsbU (phosphoserine phosphatase)
MVVVSLLTTSTTGLVSMLRIREKAGQVFVERLETDLATAVTSKAEIANAEFRRYTGYVGLLADYIHELYVKPDGYAEKEILPPTYNDKDRLSMKRYLASKNVDYRDVEEECKLLGNVTQVFEPVCEENTEIVAIYLSTESGIQISCDRDSEVTASKTKDGSEVFFNYYSRPWYGLAKEIGEVTFTNVYMDTYDRGYMITCAAPFYNKDGEFAGVVCMDLLVNQLFNMLEEFDVIEGEGDYAFLVDGNGYAVNPEYHEMNIYTDSDMDGELKKSIMKGETGVSYSQNGCYYAYAPIFGVNWKLCARVPEDMVLAPMVDMNEKIRSSIIVFIVIFAVAAILMYIMIRKFANSITWPLYALRRDAEQISSGNLDHVAKIYHDDEIGDLAHSFNDMAVSLKEYVENLTEVTTEKERISTELNVATKIQRDMLPSIFPPFPNIKEFDLYATMDPAKEVGGDFYDFFLIDDDHICLVMADVSGKGVPAALFMVIAKTLIKNRAALGGSPSEILEYANECLCEGNEAELFVTVWVAIIEISTGKGVAANAGHEHPILMRAGGDFETVKYKHSLAVAAMEGAKFKEHEFKLDPGDKLIVYTDGVMEATSRDEELFGEERALKVLNENKDASAEDILKHMKTAIDDFAVGVPQFDDITMMSFFYNGK